MYRIVCVLSLFALSVDAQAYQMANTGTPVFLWSGSTADCYAKLGVRGGPEDAVRTVLCRYACLMRSIGLMDDKGNITVDNFLNTLPQNPFRDRVGETFRICERDSQRSDDPCRTAESFYKCLDSLPRLQFDEATLPYDYNLSQIARPKLFRPQRVQP